MDNPSELPEANAQEPMLEPADTSRSEAPAAVTGNDRGNSVWTPRGGGRKDLRRTLLLVAGVVALAYGVEAIRVVHTASHVQQAYMLQLLAPSPVNGTRLAKLSARASLRHREDRPSGGEVSSEDLPSCLPELVSERANPPLKCDRTLYGMRLGLSRATVRYRIEKPDWSSEGPFDSVVVLMRDGLTWKANLAATTNRTIEAQERRDKARGEAKPASSGGGDFHGIEIYPGANTNEMGSITMSGSETKAFETTDALDTVAAFYKDRYAEKANASDGAVVSNSQKDGHAQTITWQENGATLSIIVAKLEEEEKITILLIYNKPTN
jgi:hypothetical protein